MIHRTSKYSGEQDKERHGEQLHWPGVNGIPFRGAQVPNIRREELENLPVVGYAYDGTFDLSNEEEAKYYRWVRDRCRNGLFTSDYSHREHTVVDGVLKTIIYLEWTQLYVQLPAGHKSLGSTGDGSSSTSFTLSGPG